MAAHCPARGATESRHASLRPPGAGRRLPWRVITHFPCSPISAPRWAPRPSGCRHAALSSTQEAEVPPVRCFSPGLSMPSIPAASRTLDSLGSAPSQGPHRAPAHTLGGQRQAGPGSSGLWGCHAFLPHQGHRSAGAPAWVALGLARPGRDVRTCAGTLPLGAPGLFLQAPQPRAGEYRGGFPGWKGKESLCP